jgi:hypothetical protein
MWAVQGMFGLSTFTNADLYYHESASTLTCVINVSHLDHRLESIQKMHESQDGFVEECCSDITSNFDAISSG